jgi:hypothetical protein
VKTERGLFSFGRIPRSFPSNRALSPPKNHNDYVDTMKFMANSEPAIHGILKRDGHGERSLI